MPMHSIFPWGTLNSIIGGLSAIDVPRLHVHSLEEAEEFIASYGYTWTRKEHRLELDLLREEALTFLQQELLDEAERLLLPAQLRTQTDLRELLLLASQKSDKTLQLWACSLLRVMHTLAHSDSYFNRVFGVQIREQILQRFSKHIHKKDGEVVLGEGEESITLVDFVIKQAKPKRSVVMKLLHKAENVASDIFDRIGVRIITRDRFDAMLVVRYLRMNHVIMFANIKPSRSRNTLIQLEHFQRDLTELEALKEIGEIDESEMFALLRARLQERSYPVSETSNPFSGLDYHSIQFTCRQLIRTTPLREQRSHDPAVSLYWIPKIEDFEEPEEKEEEICFFFPYEVQILDQESYERSRSGLASHREYKKRQREVVRKRVFRELLEPDSP